MNGLQLAQCALPRPSLIYTRWLFLRYKFMADTIYCFEDGMLTYNVAYDEESAVWLFSIPEP